MPAVQEVKMNTKLTLAALAIAIAAPLSAADFGFGGSGFTMPREKVQVAPPSAPEPAVKGPAGMAEWTIMVYLNGKNRHEYSAMLDFNEMEMVGSSDKVNIVVEFGRSSGYNNSDGDWKGVRRYLVKKDTNIGGMTSPVLQDLGNRDMGDYRNLAAFGKWAKQNYPARRYMLVTPRGRADGWMKSVSPQVNKGVSWDEETGRQISTPELALALREIGKVDVYASDSWMAQMPEVLYEIKDFAGYIVGSQESTPAGGYNYKTLLAPVVANPSMGAEQLARLAVDTFADTFDRIDEGYTISYISAAAIPGLLERVNEFAYAVSQAREKYAAGLAREEATCFAVRDHKDLHHFVTLMAQKSQSAEVKAKAQALTSYITGTLVKHHRNRSGIGVYNDMKNYSATRGIGIYLPRYDLSYDYKDLQWAKYSNWDEFLAWLMH
jgi:hypothetical protein